MSILVGAWRFIRAVIVMVLCAVSEGRTAAQAPVEVASICPKSIRVDQQLGGPVPGWEPRRREGRSSLESVAFYEGPPDQLVRLVPDAEEVRKAGKTAAIWKLSPSKEGYWIECEYRNTDVMISRRLEPRFTSCEVVVDATRMLNGRPSIVDVLCR